MHKLISSVSATLISCVVLAFPCLTAAHTLSLEVDSLISGQVDVSGSISLNIAADPRLKGTDSTSSGTPPVGRDLIQSDQYASIFLIVTFGTLGILAGLLSIIRNNNTLFHNVANFKSLFTLFIPVRYHILFFMILGIIVSSVGVIVLLYPSLNFLGPTYMMDAVFWLMMTFLYLSVRLIFLILRPPALNIPPSGSIAVPVPPKEKRY